MIRDILVAADGHPGALGALRVAQRLEKECGARVSVLAVFEPIDLYSVGTPEAVAHLPPHYMPAAVEAVRERVRAQLATLGGGAAEWPLAVESGRVSSTVARAAIRHDAKLILLGLSRPRGVERWLSRETLLQVIHLANVPVMAVPEDVTELPRSAVVAIDFSDFSMRVARDLAHWIAPGAELHLAHVAWAGIEGDSWTGWTEWEKSYRTGVERRLTELAAELDDPNRTVRAHVLRGDAGQEILRLAGDLKADLVAAGSHGAGFFGRLVIGSVSSKLVHGCNSSLLIAPPRSIPDEVGVEIAEGELLADLGRAGDVALPESSSG
jgi:nucleotide-binding universal stress UspA family protein